MEKFIFAENQRFTRGFPFIIIIAVNFIFLFGLYYQIIEGHSFGNHPHSNKGLILIYVFILVLTIFLTLLVRLETRISHEGVYVRFYPFQQKFKSYSWSRISNAFVRTYNPLKEYGGWGFRLSLYKSGKAYNVSCNNGLQIILSDGSKILIGTRKEQELIETLKIITMPAKTV